MKNKSIHFVGIKGVGMTPLAIIAKEAGMIVSGSDVDEEFITDEALKTAKIKPLIGFATEHINDQNLVVTTGAHNGFDNIEVKTAREKGIRVISAGEALGEFMNGKIFNKTFKGISVAGTHGKTTTAGIIATVLKENRLDPSYVVGTSKIGSLGLPGHFGKGRFFIAEADEYATEPNHDRTPRFMWQHPEIAVFTNIEFDHPDIYMDIDDIRAVFEKFANQLLDKGLLIGYGDDRQVQKILNSINKPAVTYGFSPDNNYVLDKVSISGEHMFMWVSAYGKSIGQFMLNIVGEHNGLNGLAAIVAALESGVALEKVRPAIAKYTGSKRRLEYVGELMSGAKLYDDYAHHPTAIKKTLQAMKQQYPNKKIICFFQPHTFSRTKKLFSEFVKAFDNADSVVILDIYSSSREVLDQTISSKILAEAIMREHRDVKYLSTVDDASEYINGENFRSDSVIVTMGAGDIYKIKDKLRFI